MGCRARIGRRQAKTGRSRAPMACHRLPWKARHPPPGQISPPPPSYPPPQASGPPPNVPMATANRCGAVAYTADGAFGAAYGMENCTDAERLAVDECRRESTDKADCSRGVVIRRDSWFHVQFCRLGSDWTTHITT